ncbi:MAG TPA: methyl-accepting chemotaxis protein [bacterium]|nr:methyl-accepting chemotaxis protein [bacterium]
MKASIKSKALVFLVIIPFILIALLAVLLLEVQFSKDIKNAKAMLEAHSVSIRESLHIEVARNLELLRTIATNPLSGRVISRMAGVPAGLDNDDYSGLEEFDALRDVMDYTSRNTTLDLVYVASRDSTGLVMSRDVQLATGFDVRGRDYYIAAMAAPGTSVISEPRVSAEKSAEPIIVITAARTVADSEGKVVGITAFNYRLSPIIAIIKAQMAANDVDIALYDTMGGYVLWNASDGKEYFYDPKKVIPLKDLLTSYGYTSGAVDDLAKSLADRTSHSFEVGTGARIYMTEAVPIPDTRWAMLVRFPRARVVSDVLKMIVPPLLVFVLVFFIAQFIIFILAMRSIVKPLVTVGQNLEALAAADADLTVTIPSLTKDEIGQVASSFNQFTSKMRELIVDIKHAIDGTNTIKQNVTASTEESSSAIEEISANLISIQKQIEVLDQNIKDNVSAIEQVTRNIGQVDDQIISQSAMVEQSTSAITEMMASLNNVNGIAQTKQKSTQDLSALAEDGKGNILETSNTFKSVVSHIIEIQEMASAINNIANQTNLLSMNAAIEAAHAGDAGRGFAVVADEIRKLADSAGKSSQSIGKLIKDISDAVRVTDQNLDRTSEAFEHISVEVTGTVNAFSEIEQAVSELNIGGRQILDSINEINDVTVHIREGSRDIKAGTRVMLDSSSRIEDVSNRVTTGMAEATMGSAEIVRSMQLLVEQARDLSTIVDALRHKFGQFKTE